MLSRFFSELDISTRHYAFCHGEKSSDVVSIVGLAITPREWRDNLRWHVAAKNVRACTDNGARAEHCSDAGFRMIAEERADKLLASAPDPGGSPELNWTISILEVAGGRQSAEVDPPSEIGVTDEAGVCLVAVPEDDRVAHLAVHLAVIANRRHRDAISQNLRIATNSGRTHKVCKRRDRRAAADEYGARCGVEHDVRSDVGALLYEDSMIANRCSADLRRGFE